MDMKPPVDVFLDGKCDSELLTEKSKPSCGWRDNVLYMYVYIVTFVSLLRGRE